MKVLLSILLITFLSFNSLFSQNNDDKHPILKDKFTGNIGVYVPSKKVSFGLDGSSPNDIINFSDSFNLNDNEVTPFFNFAWRFSEKWKLGVEYFGIKNANKLELEEDIVFDNITFKKGSNIRGGFGVNMYRIFVGRSFSRGLKHEFGAGLGIHALNTSAFIEGDVQSTEGDVSFERRAVSALIPLPNIGIWYYYAPTNKLALVARLDWFGITVGDYSGGLWNVAPGIKYQLFKNVGIGVDYRYFLFRASVNKTDWKGEFNMTFQGPLFAINVNF